MSDGTVLHAERSWVQLHQPLRFTLMQNATVLGRHLSYVVLDWPSTAYDTDHDAPRALGTPQQLAAAAASIGRHALGLS